MHPYVLALIGGGLIGVSAVMLMAFSGRIAGISGIVGGLLPPKPADDRTWRIAFILGLVLAPTVLTILTGDNRIGAADGRACAADRRGPACGRRHGARQRLHVRSRHLRHVAIVAALGRGYRHLRRHRDGHRLRRPPRLVRPPCAN